MAHHTNTAVFLLVAAALVTAGCTGETTDSTTTTSSVSEPIVAETTTTATVLPATTTTAAAQETEALQEALAVKDAFFVAFNAADPTAVMDLFTADAEFGEDGREWFEELLAWNIAQGTRYTPSDCEAKPHTDSQGVVVSCPFITHDALSIESDGPPVPFNMSILIAADGIASYLDRFGDPDFNTVAIPFGRWMEQHHPADVESVSFAAWESIDGAVANGTLRADYAAEWGRYLKANGCAYNESC
ncbi:MAG: hypothetical protein ACR2NG_06375 [Acidimicrobiia bacterium]